MGAINSGCQGMFSVQAGCVSKGTTRQRHSPTLAGVAQILRQDPCIAATKQLHHAINTHHTYAAVVFHHVFSFCASSLFTYTLLQPAHQNHPQLQVVQQMANGRLSQRQQMPRSW